MRRTLHPQSVAELGLLLVAVIWGGNFVVIKAALAEVHPLLFNALRFPLAGAIFLLILAFRRGGERYPPLRREDLLKVVGLGLLGNVAYQLVFIFGLEATTAGNASLILATVPVWVILISFVSGHEHPNPKVWLGCGLTLVGMVFVVLGDPNRVGGVETSLFGDGLMVLAAIAWSGYTVGGRDLIHRYGSLSVTTWTLWAGLPFLIGFGVPFAVASEVTSWPWMVWGSVVYAGVGAISISYVLWYRGVRELGSSRTAAYSNLVPVVALIVAWVWLNEVPGPIQWVGAVIILCGISLTRGRNELKPGYAGDGPISPAVAPLSSSER